VKTTLSPIRAWGQYPAKPVRRLGKPAGDAFEGRVDGSRSDGALEAVNRHPGEEISAAKTAFLDRLDRTVIRTLIKRSR
jgi:hypothetical protein